MSPPKTSNLLLVVHSFRYSNPITKTPYHCHRPRRLHSTAPAVTAAAKPFEPLRILFCGADEFSNYSLRALVELQQRRPELIESINVVCRPDKRVGRGLRRVQEGKNALATTHVCKVVNENANNINSSLTNEKSPSNPSPNL